MSVDFDWNRVRTALQEKVDAAESKAAVALKAGMPVSTLQNILRGESVPGFDKVAKLAAVLGLNLNLLAYGSPRLGGSVADGMLMALAEIEANKRRVFNEELFDYIDDFTMDVSAGAGVTIFQQPPIGMLAFHKDWIARRFGNKDRLAIVRVRGDSMEPELRDGDRVMIDKSKTTPADGLFVLTHEDQAKIKRVQVVGKGRLLLLSSNPAYQPEEVRPADPGVFFKIEGRAVWLGRNL